MIIVKRSPHYRSLWVAKLIQDGKVVFVTQGSTKLMARLNLWRRAYKAGYI